MGSTLSRVFTKQHRLHSKASFKRVFDDPLWIKRQRLFSVLAKPNVVGMPRLGVIVSKRRVKQAVARNYLKRKVREGFRLSLTQLPQCDFIVIVKQDFTGYENMKDKIDSLFLPKSHRGALCYKNA